MSDSRAPSIEFDQVVLRRGSRLVFDGLSLVLTQRRVGLLGNNGAGKSSFLRLINGLLLPDGGAVRVDGLDTVGRRRELPLKVGFVFQNPEHQIVFPTVREEMAFGFRQRGVGRKAADEKALETLEMFECGDWVDAAVHELSDGQKQRLCIMSIVAMQPDILVMDEPLASLDLPTRLELTDFLLQLPQRLVVASHELELLGMMERVVWLRDGAIAGDGAPEAVISAYRRSVQATRRAAADR